MVAKVLTIKPARLHQPVGPVARLLMRKRLAIADSLLESLDDPEAVHEFRVAMRRARSIEKAYRPHLTDVVSRKLRRRLKEVVAATGATRDTEVQLAQLAQRCVDPKPHHRPGLEWLRERLEQRLEAERRHLKATLAERFRLVHKPLRARLKARSKVAQPGFAEVTAGLLLEVAGDFSTRCAQILDDPSEEPLHTARISGKRLRYLLEPLTLALPGAAEQVAALKVLQDLLGEIHDLQVFGQELAAASEEAGAARMRRLIEMSLALPLDDPELERARQDDERAGLMSLARDLRTRQIDLVEHLRARLRAGAAESLAASVRETARDCGRAALPEPTNAS